MKYYYGNSMKEALSNAPVEIKSAKVLRQYNENYSVVLCVDDIEDDCDNQKGLLMYLVTFDIDNQNLGEEFFKTKEEAYHYAKDNIINLPCVTKCWQSDLNTELGDGDDYDEEDITRDDTELAEMLDKYI